MGGFFATNDPSRMKDGIALFEKKGFAAPKLSEAESVSVASFPKLAVPDHRNVFQDHDTKLIGIGSYGYRDQFASAALPLILRDHLAGKNPFASVVGHAAFIVQNADGTRLFTDKTGIYHCLCAEEGERYYVSNSLLAVAGGVRRLFVSRQGVTEYLHTETTFGGGTIFGNIRHLPGGTVFLLGAKGIQEVGKFYNPEDKVTTIEDFAEIAVDYLKVFDNCPYPMMAELSGGRDSRTVVAALQRRGLDYAIGTNRTDYSNNYDLITAQKVAERLNRPIAEDAIFPAEIGEMSEGQIRKGIYILETCRNVMRAARHVDYFEYRSAQAPVVFGGVGAELLRDHARARDFQSIAELAAGKYLNDGILVSKQQRDEYLDRLSQKLAARLALLGESDVKKGVPKIHYFEKLRTWCGGRITSWNQYSFRVQPFMDHLLAGCLFKVPLSEFAGNDYQRRVIELLSPGLGDVSFLDEIRKSTGTAQPRGKALQTMATNLPGSIRVSFGPPYMGGGKSPLRRLARLYRLAKKSSYGLERHLGDLATLNNLEPQFSKDLSDFIGLSPDHFVSPGPFGKYVTVVRIIELFKDKVEYGSASD